MSEEAVAFTGLIVLVRGKHDKLHLAPLTLKQAARVRRFVTQFHGGTLHVAPADLILLTEADALETFGRLTGRVPFWERVRRFFRRGSTESRPTKEERTAQLTVLPRAEEIGAASPSAGAHVEARR